MLNVKRIVVVGHFGFGDAEAESLDGRSDVEACVDVSERGEGADHEAGADEQHKGERDLNDDKDVAGAVALAALAQGTAAFAKAGADAHAGVTQGRDRPEEDAAEQGDGTVKTRTVKSMPMS